MSVLCVNLLIKIEQTTFPPRFNSLSLNLYEEMENHQKRTENQVIKYEQEQLSRANQYLALLQEKLVRALLFPCLDVSGESVSQEPRLKPHSNLQRLSNWCFSTGIGIQRPAFWSCLLLPNSVTPPGLRVFLPVAA